MFLLLVFMSFHFNCMSFHFDDPRSGMYNPMSVKRILNAKGTAFTALLFTRERLYFIPLVPSSTSACITCKYQSIKTGAGSEPRSLYQWISSEKTTVSWSSGVTNSLKGFCKMSAGSLAADNPAFLHWIRCLRPKEQLNEGANSNLCLFLIISYYFILCLLISGCSWIMLDWHLLQIQYFLSFRLTKAC